MRNIELKNNLKFAANTDTAERLFLESLAVNHACRYLP